MKDLNRINELLYELYNGVLLLNEKRKSLTEEEYKRLILLFLKNGYYPYPAVLKYYDFEDLSFLLDNTKLNQTFHKSWKIIKDTPMDTLLAMTLLHYATTYGREAGNIQEYINIKLKQFEQKGLYVNKKVLVDEFLKILENKDDGYVYYPAEQLNIPEHDNPVRWIKIKGLTVDWVLNKIKDTLNTDVATNENFIELIQLLYNNGIFKPDAKFIYEIKNREVKYMLYKWLNLHPTDEDELVKYIHYLVSGNTLFVQSHEVFFRGVEGKGDWDMLMELYKKRINLNGAMNKNDWDTLLNLFNDETVLYKLARVFNRYKKFLIQLKIWARSFEGGEIIAKRINQISKYSKRVETKHYPYIIWTKVTELISNGKWNKNTEDTFLKSLYYTNIFKLVRLYNALQMRAKMHEWGGYFLHIYKIRNGKMWVTKKFVSKDKNLAHLYNWLSEKVKETIQEKIDLNLRSGRKVYINPNIKFALPSTYKKLVGGFPEWTKINIPDKNLLIGIWWKNIGGRRVDLDLSLVSREGKFGWNAWYKNKKSTILFSGDITDAPSPNGASEVIYIRDVKKNIERIPCYVCNGEFL